MICSENHSGQCISRLRLCCVYIYTPRNLLYGVFVYRSHPNEPLTQMLVATRSSPLQKESWYLMWYVLNLLILRLRYLSCDSPVMLLGEKLKHVGHPLS